MAENKSPSSTDYSLASTPAAGIMAAPVFPYKPRDPAHYKPGIGMIACGGITESHLTAYKQAGYNVVMLCDLIEERALNRQEQFYPESRNHNWTHYRELLAWKRYRSRRYSHSSGGARLALIEAALLAGQARTES